MPKKLKVVLEIGVGKKAERLFRYGKKNPHTIYIGFDPDLESEESPLPNVKLIKKHFDEKHLPPELKINEVWMHNLNTPLIWGGIDKMLTVGDKNPYDWLRNENHWLADNHKIKIVDANTSQMYPSEKFDESLKNFKKELEPWGYNIHIEAIPKKGFKKKSDWDSFFEIPSITHVVKIILNKKRRKDKH